MKKTGKIKNKKSRTKSEILHAAEKVFQKWGLNKTTMDDIAVAAGKSKGSLYYYYKDKEEILNIIISGYIKDMIEKSSDEMDNQKATKDKLKVYFITLDREFRKYINLFGIVRGEIKKYPELIENTRSKFNSANAKLIHDVILKGIRNGEFRSFNKSTIDIICYSIISFMTTLAMDFSLENKRFNVKRRIDIFIEILFNGLRN